MSSGTTVMVWIEVRIVRLVHYLAAHAQNMMLVFTEKMSSAQFKSLKKTEQKTWKKYMYIVNISKKSMLNF